MADRVLKAIETLEGRYSQDNDRVIHDVSVEAYREGWLDALRELKDLLDYL